MNSIQKIFVSSPYFAVVGASKDKSKYGTKVLKWYQDRSLRVKPVHPKETELEGLSTIKSISELDFPTQTSVSIVTPPAITLNILRSAKDLSIPALWLQPGAEDATVVDFVKTNGLEGRVIYGGPCILVQGDDLLHNRSAL